MRYRIKRGRILASLLAGGLLVWAVGCDHISEPWVRQPDQLQQERARTPQASLELKNRLRAVQTDR
jgi:hypothetical protein